MAFADRIYQRSPQAIQTILLNAYALSLHRVRFGRAFRALLADW